MRWSFWRRNASRVALEASTPDLPLAPRSPSRPQCCATRRTTGAAIRKQSGLAEKIILPGDRDRLGCVTQIRVRATCQRDEFSLCTSKFESDMASHAVGLTDVSRCDATPR